MIAPNKEVEWCWAFSLTEKELIYSMHESMFVCMYLLRAVKNKHWILEKKPNEPSLFSSYFIKTACLWICEETPQDYDNVIGLVEKVIDWLLACYHKKEMPHYILPQKNLLERVVKDENYGMAIVWLEDIKANLLEKLQTSLDYDHDVDAIQEIMEHLQTSLTDIPEVMMEKARLVLTRDGENYNKRERYTTGRLASRYCIPVRMVIKEGMMGNVSKLFNMKYVSWEQCLPFMGFFSKEIINMAEKIFLPALEDVPTLAQPGYESLANVYLNKELGGVYHTIYCMLYNFNTPENPKESEIYHKAIQYFKKCSLCYPNGWHDKGLEVKVLLGMHYCITKQWDDLEGILSGLEPLLMEAKESTDILKSVIYVRVDEESALAEAGQHQRRHCIWDETTIHRHPVFLGFYFLEIIAHERGNLPEEKRYRMYKEEVDNVLVSWD